MRNSPMKLFRLLVLGAWALACGGEPQEFSDEEMELGQVEQGVLTYGSYGVNLSGGAPNEGSQCSASGSTVNCLLPLGKEKNIRCNTGTISGGDLSTCTTIIDQEVQAYGNQFDGSGWQFGRTTAGGNVVVDRVALAGGSPATDIRPYVQIGHGGCSAVLAESPAVSGSFKKCSNTTCGIDFAKIDTKFTNSADRLRIKAHALGMCVAASVGIGYTSAVNNRKNSIAITATSAKNLELRSSDACLVDNYGQSGNTVTHTLNCP